MDVRNGQIYTHEQLREIRRSLDPLKDFLRPIRIPLTPRQRETGKIGRNDPCPCGSGRKFKRCCLETGHE